MQLENTKTQMRKGILEYCILNIIAKDKAYTNDIISELKDAELLVVEGTVYPLLTRLKKAELLEYEWVESSSGPPRKYYKLSENGKTFLLELGKTWHHLQNAVNSITNSNTDKQTNHE